MYAGALRNREKPSIYSVNPSIHILGAPGFTADPRQRGKALHSIPGTVPNPAYKPAGVLFIPDALTRSNVSKEFPAMCDYGGGHMGRCPVLYERRIRIMEKAARLHALLKVQGLQKYFPVRRGFLQKVIGWMKGRRWRGPGDLPGKTLGWSAKAGAASPRSADSY